MDSVARNQKEELIRLIEHYLYDQGYKDAAAKLEEESAIRREEQVVQKFREALFEGKLDFALEQLDSILSDPSNKPKAEYYIYVEKYLELLEAGSLDAALECLKKCITPRSTDPSKLYHLASLMACRNKAQLYEKADWGGGNIESRKKLLVQLLTFISPQKIMDSRRLETLVNQALQYQILQCKYHNTASTELSLMQNHQCKNNKIPSVCIKTLTLHTDEVWGVHFSSDGKYFATVSRDNVVIIWSVTKHPAEGRVEIRAVWKLKAHDRQIYGFCWANSGKFFATVSGDNSVKVWSNETGKCCYAYDKHKDSVHAVAFYDNDQKVISGGIDKLIFITKLDGSSSDNFKSVRVGDLKVDDERHLLYAIEAAGNKIVCYNLLNKQELYRIEEKENIISCDFSLDKRYLLVNASFKHPQLRVWDLESKQIIKRYAGHVQEKYYIKGVFGGYAQSFIACGSEDALIYVWNRSTEALLNTMPGHTSIVNCVAWSPTDHAFMVSGSDDYTVKVWDTKEWKVELFNDASIKEERLDILQPADLEDMGDDD